MAERHLYAAAAMPDNHPIVTLLEGRHKRAVAGHPWVYSNEIQMDAAAKTIPPGSIAALRVADGRPLGLATFNPHSLIAARLLTRDMDASIDASFLRGRLTRALETRESIYKAPYYRLVHAEGDGLPGLIVDRFGDVLVVQMNTAGMDTLAAPLIEALNDTVVPKTIILRNDSAARELEGLESYARVAVGKLDGPVSLLENACNFFCDPVDGQKTGWFYDQRDNRAFVAALAGNKRVADFYCYAGGFGVCAAAQGATEVIAVDRSGPALEIAAMAAERNEVGDRCRFIKNEAFRAMHQLLKDDESFDVVIADPPAFVKSRKDLAAGLRGYRKMVASAGRLVRPGGVLLVASCSYHVDSLAFAEQVRRGIRDAKRGGRILRVAGAAPDHPAHVFLPETAYLKAMVLQLD